MRVRPFRGIRYNQKIIDNLAEVMCPPYDVISAEHQKLYYERSEYNAIRLEFPQLSADRYKRAASTFRQWLMAGVLQTDDIPAFYLHDHHFEYSGRGRMRRGLIARVKLEPWGKGIYPHEQTLPKAKSDRLQMMRACRAAFSPLLSLYRDCDGKVASILAQASLGAPICQTKFLCPSPAHDRDWAVEQHSLWAITDPEINRQLSDLLSGQALYIADGHHRYETALTYQQERVQQQSQSLVGASKAKQIPSDAEAFNYVMMELVEASDPGLVVLPIHRLIRGIAPATLDRLPEHLANFFVLEPVPLNMQDITRCYTHTLATSEAGPSHEGRNVVLGVLGLQPEVLLLLRRRQDISLDALMPPGKCQAYRQFDISILNHVVMDGLLGGAQGLEVSYVVDLKEVYRQIDERRYQLAFLVKPPDPQIVTAVADSGDRMPAKSTYFYPKLPAGLLINPLD